MDHPSSRATQERLLHALERLQAEPRSGERRSFDRRRLARPAWAIDIERRMLADRRRSDRRT